MADHAPRFRRLLGAALVVASCTDAAAPRPLSIAVAPASRALGVHEDSVTTVVADSAVVVLRGEGSGAARWSATHGGAPWLTLVAAGGGSGVAVRWVVDPTVLPPGTYVDTITVAASGASAELVDTLVVRGAPAQLITVRRPWLPGEQAAAIAEAEQNHTPLPYVGDVSSLAADMFGGDSVTVVVTNPAYAPGSGRLPRAAQFSAGWSAMGLDLSIQDRSAVPWDTLNWLGVMWWNPADSTWKGWTIVATKAATVKLTNVSTTAFDASQGTSGAGGGEAQQSTGTYWEASSGQVQISRNNGCGTTTTVASGVWKGGTKQTCNFGGRLVNLTMPRRAGSTAPATQTINFDFRSPPIVGSRLTCVFPSPCTGAAVIAALRARRTAMRPPPRSP